MMEDVGQQPPAYEERKKKKKKKREKLEGQPSIETISKSVSEQQEEHSAQRLSRKKKKKMKKQTSGEEDLIRTPPEEEEENEMVAGVGSSGGNENEGFEEEDGGGDRAAARKTRSRLPADIQEENKELGERLEKREIRKAREDGRRRKKGGKGSSKVSLRDDTHFKDPVLISVLSGLQDDMASVDGEYDPDRIPSPVTPNLPVSQHVDKVFTERQGRGGGFSKSSGRGKIDPTKLLDNLNQAGAAMGLPTMAAASEPSMTPLELGLKGQRAFRSFGIFCHGFLAGLAFWQLIMVYVMSDGRAKEDYSPLDFIELYSPLAQPLQCMFYVLTVVCTISILDRYDFAQFDWGHQLQQIVTLRSGAMAIFIYCASLVLTLSTTKLDDKISLYQINATIFEAMEPQVLESELSTWKTLNLCRCLGVIIGWILVSLRPSTDLLQKNLKRLGAYSKGDSRSRSQQQLRT